MGNVANAYDRNIERLLDTYIATFFARAGDVTPYAYKLAGFDIVTLRDLIRHREADFFSLYPTTKANQSAIVERLHNVSLDFVSDR